MQASISTSFFLLFFLTLRSLAQTGPTVSGTVQSEDKLPLVGISIRVKNSSLGTTTDTTGAFQLRVNRTESLTITASAVGFLPQSKEVRAGQSVAFILKADARTMNEIVVTGKTENQQAKEQAFAVNAIETRLFANTNVDMNQVLNRTTGVRVREQGGLGSDFNFSINGLSGKAVRFFVDGIPLEVMGSSLTLNTIPVNLAERIEVYKGVVPVSLGSDAMGGAVNLITNQHIRNYLDASYSYSSFNTHRAALTGQYIHPRTGLTLRANAFYNYSDNTYIMRGIEIWDADREVYVKKDLRRFHDTFQSAMGQLEVGVNNKKWADVFFVGASYNTSAQDIQTGTRQEVVYGAATRHGDAWNTSVRYRKNNFMVQGLDVNAFLSRSVDNYVVVDTAGYQYAWDGSRVKTNQAEIGYGRSLNRVIRPKTFGRVNASYALTDQHSINVNYTFDHVKNKMYNELVEEGDASPGVLGKHLLGLAYQQNLLDQRLTTTYFGKYHGMSIAQDRALDTSGETSSVQDFIHRLGYGVASRFRISESIGVKASYERSYRLQEVGEMFGNGYTIIANLDLKPEASHNVNVGAFLNKRVQKHHFFAEASWFFRDASDFIYAVVYQSNRAVSRYANTSKVRVNGLEAEFRYDYDHLLSIMVNGSYQNAINTTQYAPGSTGTPEATYLNKIPNQPWAFGNADISLGKNDLLGKNTRLQLNWGAQYVHWFYLSWEAFGTKSSLNRIPTQFIQNASLTYSRENGKYNISFESRNLANALAYDNFRLQKPGRAFGVKLRYFIQ